MKRNNVKEICCRKASQIAMSLLLPLVVVGGYYHPILGFTVLALITVFMVLSSRRGRFYCGWLCPMGAFHERFLAKMSLHKPIPALFKSCWLRWVLFSVMMSFMASQLFLAWGDYHAVGDVFRTMWIISTGMAIVLGVYFKPRIWCSICPMGSMQGASSKNTYLLTVEDSCAQCKKCQKVCPVSTYPGSFKKDGVSGQVPSIECLRCSNCVENCPKKVLSFQDRLDL